MSDPLYRQIIDRADLATDVDRDPQLRAIVAAALWMRQRGHEMNTELFALALIQFDAMPRTFAAETLSNN
jgi:hypothetical protein